MPTSQAQNGTTRSQYGTYGGAVFAEVPIRPPIMRDMANVDLSALTSTQLETMRDNLVTAVNDVLTNKVQSSSHPDGGAFSSLSLTQLTELLSAVSSELASRDDDLVGITGGFLQAELGEPA